MKTSSTPANLCRVDPRVATLVHAFFNVFCGSWKVGARCLGMVVLFFVCGCCTDVPPTPPQDWTKLCAKEIPALGESILNSPFCQNPEEPILLKVGSMLDKTRFTVDTDLLMKKMRTYLVNHGKGRVAVFDDDSTVIEFCKKRQAKKMYDALKDELKYVALRIAKAAEFKGRQVKVAAMPIEMDALGERNGADGILSLLRAEIVGMSGGRFVFLSREKVDAADYLLKGSLVSVDTGEGVGKNGGKTGTDLNLRIVFEKPAAAGIPCFEISMPVQRKVFAASLDATCILSGELNVLTRETPSQTDDFVRMGFNIIDPDTRLHMWEGACEISVTSYKSILYQ